MTGVGWVKQRRAALGLTRTAPGLTKVSSTWAGPGRGGRFSG